ncbi:MAG: hypothetical protein ABIQ57_15280 [Candidatus Kapaibacterium sp.]
MRVPLLLFIWIIITVVASGQTEQPKPEMGWNAVYGEVATGLLMGEASINYDRRFSDHFSARIGTGLGYMFSNGIHGSFGGLFMLNYFNNGKEPGMEIGAGLSYSLPRNDSVVTRLNPTPAISFGLRYQSDHDFFRFGLTYDFRFGFPLQLSMGKSF